MGLKQNSSVYELNISCLSNNVKDIVLEAAILGYQVMVLNTVMYQSHDDTKSKKNSTRELSLPPPVKLILSSSDLEKREIKTAPTLLSRLTIKLAHTRDDLDEVLEAARAQYDLVAVAPATDAALIQCCQSCPDLISFDGSSEIGTLALRHLPAALHKDVYVELLYDACVGSSSASSRQQCIRQHRSVCSAVCGQQVVVSSGTADPGRLRSPADVVNLCSLLGLPSHAAHSALTRSCTALLHSCEQRRRRCVQQPAPDHTASAGAVVVFPPKKKKRKVFDHDLANVFLTSFTSSVKRSKI